MNLLKKSLLAICCFFYLSGSAEKLSDSFFDDADAFLKRYITTSNLVNYPAIKNESGIDDIIKQVEEMDLSEATDNEKKAFYINAYNLSVIAQVMDHYPVNSVLTDVKDANGNDLDGIEGFFGVNKQTVAGEEVTLDFLEKERLIKAFDDNRIHFVVVCAALSCPPIIRDAYRPETLEAQIETQTSLSINDASFTRINRENKTAELSQIYSWFEDDFGGSVSSTISFLNDYLEEPISQDYSVSFYFYDWSINEFLGDPNGLFDVDESAISIAVNQNQLSFSETDSEYTLIGMNGAVYMQGGTDEILDLNSLETGVYIIKIGFKNELFSEKIYVK